MRKSRTKQVLAAATAAAAIAALGLTPDATAVTSTPTSASASDATTDSRAGAITKPTEAQAAAVAAIVKASPGTRATWDARFGTVRTLTPAIGETLSGPASGSAVDVAKAWLSAHKDALGLSAADIAALDLRRDHELPGTGTHVVQFTQTFDGVAAARGGSLGLAVQKDGSVLSYTGETIRSSGLVGSFKLSSAEALQGVAGKLADALTFVASKTGTKAGYDVFAKGPFAGSSYVKKAAFPTADGARAAYSVLFVQKLDEAYQVVVDAETGKQLYKTSLVDHEAGGTIYENAPGAPSGGQPTHVSFGPNDASPKGYVDPTGLAGTGVTTFGNNANTHANWSNYIAPVDQGPRPVSPTGQFDYVFANHWGQSTCDPTSYPQDQEAASTNLFYQHNRVHDRLYRLGFTESAGNFQLTDGAGTGGQGGDAIQGLVQAGALSGGSPTYTGRDNAYMLTLPDGIPPWSGMFLWEPIDDAFEGPCADGDFDAGVIEHEYTHGLSNRYVGTEDGSLGTHQSGSMGEGWSDFYALDYLTRAGLQDDSVVGSYVTGNKSRGIRNWAYDANPTTFGDVGYDLVGPEVHADGEIWTATLWQMTKALRAKYGMQDGSDIAEHLVTDAMPLSPNDPSMLDERTAIMTALDNRYHARGDFDTLVDTVYSVFAQRGMGVTAHNTTSESDPTGGNDTDGVPGFENRNPDLNGTISGTVFNASTGKPVEGARIMLGKFEARATPVATTGPTGVFRITATQATYPLTVQSRGFGSKTFDGVVVTKGQTTTKNLALAPNLASKTFGATAVTGGSGAAMDDTEASSWKTAKGSSTVIKLAKEAVVDKVQVSAYTNSRFEGLKSFTLQTSTDGVNWKTQSVGGTDAFGYQAPRPVVPDLHYKTFTLPTPTKAGFIRFWADEPQGNTKTNVQVGDIQVFSSTVSGLTPPPPPPLDKPVTDTFTIAVGNPANVVSPGVVGTELENACIVPPASQDSDGHVTVLEGEAGDGQHAFSLASGPTAVDADVYMYDADCVQLASYATESPNEGGTIPSGTAYVLTSLYAGAAADETLTITDTK